MASQRDESTRLAEAILRFRQLRPSSFPAEMFGERGYEFLLALFIADAHGERLTGRAVCARLAISTDTGSRWLKYLANEGFVIGDGVGDLDDTLTLAPIAVDRMEDLLRGAKDLRRALLSDF